MMRKLTFVLLVCILKTCASGVNGICCEEIKALVEKKEEGFKTLCVQRNTLSLVIVVMISKKKWLRLRMHTRRCAVTYQVGDR